LLNLLFCFYPVAIESPIMFSLIYEMYMSDFIEYVRSLVSTRNKINSQYIGGCNAKHHLTIWFYKVELNLKFIFLTVFENNNKNIWYHS